MLNQTVKELILMSPHPRDVALAFADLGIGPRFAAWSVRDAAEAMGLNPDVVERRVGAVLPAA